MQDYKFFRNYYQKSFLNIQIHPYQLWKKIHSSGGNLSIDKSCYYDQSNKIATIKPELLKINDDTSKRRAAFAKAKKKYGDSVSLPSRDKLMANKKKEIKVVELFAGVGGFRLGLEGWKGKSASSGYKKPWRTPGLFCFKWLIINKDTIIKQSIRH